MGQNEVFDRLERIEDTMVVVKETIAKAKGTMTAGVGFVGVLNALFLPALVWLFSTTLTNREVSVAQGVKIERLESTCEEYIRNRDIHAANAVKKPEEPPKDKIRPATSETSVSWRNEE